MENGNRISAMNIFANAQKVIIMCMFVCMCVRNQISAPERGVFFFLFLHLFCFQIHYVEILLSSWLLLALFLSPILSLRSRQMVELAAVFAQIRTKCFDIVCVFVIIIKSVDAT